MKSTFKILFYLKKNEPKKNGHVVIMVRITVDGDQVQFSSKLDVHPDNWDTKLGRAVVNKQSAEKKENLRVSSLNKTLDEIRAAITMHYTRMMNTDGYALPEKIRNAFLGLEEKDKTLISYFTQHNEQYAKKVGKTATQKTYSRYELTKQRMIEFLKSEYNISDIPIKEITVTHIENFYLYLREQCEVSNNTAMKFVQRFHTILLFAQKSGLSFLDPFNNFRFNFDKTDRGYLTQEEIDTIYHKEFQSKRLEQVRDAFIFSCYTGLPYCDIYTLTAEDIQIGVDGKKWIMKDRGKTGVESLIPLLPIPLEILAKYEGKTKNGNVWLTKHELAHLFGVFIQTIDANMRSIFKSHILNESEATIMEKQDKRYVIYYNLDRIPLRMGSAADVRCTSHIQRDPDSQKLGLLYD